MSTNKPQDPRATLITPEEIAEQFHDIVDEPVDTLADEVDLLGRAHMVLHNALQGN